jgi:hypothetical protein
MQENPEREEDQEAPPEDAPEEPGAEGGSTSAAADQVPALPSEDDSPLGDTDQHSEG